MKTIVIADQMMLAKAISLAAGAHQYQLDKGGLPYILHPLAVLDRVSAILPNDVEAQCAAVMHDVLEDCERQVDRSLLKEVFGWRVTQMVQRVTKREGESHADYIERVCLSKETMVIKACDIEHNSDIRRLKGLTEKDFARTLKYQRDYDHLKQKLAEQHNIHI